MTKASTLRAIVHDVFTYLQHLVSVMRFLFVGVHYIGIKGIKRKFSDYSWRSTAANVDIKYNYIKLQSIILR